MGSRVRGEGVLFWVKTNGFWADGVWQLSSRAQRVRRGVSDPRNRGLG